MSARATKDVTAMTQDAVAAAAEQLRARALIQADDWNSNTSGLRETTLLNEWRDWCRDEIRDKLVSDHTLTDCDKLLAAWGKAFDGATMKQKLLINGFEPVTAEDIDDAVTIAYPQAEAIGAIFRSIGRLSEDRDVKILCQCGALQADTIAGDIDFLRERAVKAGLVGGAA